MPADPPVDFEALAKSGGSSATGGYPYQISSRDLMKNFVFATLEVEDGLFESISGKGGHPQRKLKIPKPPGSGTYVLGSVSGQFQWIQTEACA
jgi:hypothetical protein